MSREALTQEYQTIQDLKKESLRIVHESKLLIIRTVFWSARMMLRNMIIGQKNASALATVSNLAMIEDALFNFVAQSVRGMPPVVAEANAISAEKVGIAFQHGVMFWGLLMIPTATACMFVQSLFSLLQQSETTIQASTAYFQKDFFFFCFDSFYRLIARTLIGVGNTHWPLYADALEAVADITTLVIALELNQDPVQAAATAFAVSGGITALASIAYLYFSKECVPYRFFDLHHHEFSLATLKKATTNCLPQGLAGMMEYIGQTITTMLCGWYGRDALLADATAKNFITLTLPTTATATKAGVLISEAKTKGNTAFHLIGNACLLLNTSYAMIACSLLLPFGEAFVRAFIKDAPENKAAYQLGLYFTMIMACRELLDVVKSTAATTLAGCQDTQYAAYVKIFCVFLLNGGLAFSATQYLKTDEKTMYSTQLVGYFFAAMFIMERWHHCTELEKSWFYRIKNAGCTLVSSISSLWSHISTKPSVSEQTPSSDTTEMPVIHITSTR